MHNERDYTFNLLSSVHKICVTAEATPDTAKSDGLWWFARLRECPRVHLNMFAVRRVRLYEGCCVGGAAIRILSVEMQWMKDEKVRQLKNVNIFAKSIEWEGGVEIVH